MNISRRQGLTFLAAGTSLMASSAYADAALSSPLTDRLLTFLRMRGMRDGRLAIGYLSGPWLNMGARPRHMLGFGVGRYGIASVNDSPLNWIAVTRARRPEILDDPERGLGA